MSRTRLPRHGREGGGFAVEFALITVVFVSLLIGIMEMSRVLLYMNTAAEATRLGARVAVVCDVGASIVKTRMIGMLGILNAGDITVDYRPAGCSVSSCQSVTVSVTKSVSTYIPFVPLTFSLPSFSTTLPRESLTSADNAICS